jgi:hypothetical protein
MTSRVLIRLYISLAKSAGGMFLSWASALTRLHRWNARRPAQDGRRPAAIGMATAARLPTLMMLAPAAKVIKPRRVGSTGLIADEFMGGVLCTRLGHWISVLYGSG